jgi:hypothetical protein
VVKVVPVEEFCLGHFFVKGDHDYFFFLAGEEGFAGERLL